MAKRASLQQDRCMHFRVGAWADLSSSNQRVVAADTEHFMHVNLLPFRLWNSA